jgi:biotin transport system substrate-specific component
VAAYLAQGLAGLPFFAGGNAGAAYFASFTGGYLLGFLAAAVVVTVLRDRVPATVRLQADDRHTWQIATMVAGNVVIYVFGVAWLALRLESLGGAIVAGMLPFLIGDAAKIAIVSALLPRRSLLSPHR